MVEGAASQDRLITQRLTEQRLLVSVDMIDIEKLGISR